MSGKYTGRAKTMGRDDWDLQRLTIEMRHVSAALCFSFLREPSQIQATVGKTDLARGQPRLADAPLKRRRYRGKHDSRRENVNW